MNISDGERIETVLSEMGLQRTANEREAEILGLVACSVRQTAIDKVYSKINMWNKWKEKRQLLTFASGCILPADKQKMLKLFDLIFSIQELDTLPELIAQYGVPLPQSYRMPSSTALSGHNLSDDSDDAARYLKIIPHYSSTFEAFVPIQNGCNKFCTFCAVPYTRGREVSRPSQEILAEIQRLVDHNYRTITLLGQNVNSYGLDKPNAELSFAQLLIEIAKITDHAAHRCWIYFTSPHPRDFNEHLFTIMAEHPSIAKQIHLPLQSGDDKVLMRMNRKHSMARYRELVTHVRALLPQATLFTDIIVGFSGESEAQFENTRAAMHEFQYNMAYIARYSPRPGAASSRWKDDIPHAEKKRRYAILTKELYQSAFAYNRNLIGKTIDALVIAPDRKDGYLATRSEGKIPMRIKSDDHTLIGAIIPIKIMAANGLSLEGVPSLSAARHASRTDTVAVAP